MLSKTRSVKLLKWVCVIHNINIRWGVKCQYYVSMISPNDVDSPCTNWISSFSSNPLFYINHSVCTVLKIPDFCCIDFFSWLLYIGMHKQPNTCNCFNLHGHFLKWLWLKFDKFDIFTTFPGFSVWKTLEFSYFEKFYKTGKKLMLHSICLFYLVKMCTLARCK